MGGGVSGGILAGEEGGDFTRACQGLRGESDMERQLGWEAPDTWPRLWVHQYPLRRLWEQSGQRWDPGQTFSKAIRGVPGAEQGKRVLGLGKGRGRALTAGQRAVWTDSATATEKRKAGSPTDPAKPGPQPPSCTTPPLPKQKGLWASWFSW